MLCFPWPVADKLFKQTLFPQSVPRAVGSKSMGSEAARFIPDILFSSFRQESQTMLDLVYPLKYSSKAIMPVSGYTYCLQGKIQSSGNSLTRERVTLIPKQSTAQALGTATQRPRNSAEGSHCTLHLELQY